MAFDEALVEHVRGLLADQETLREQKMFGGLSFMVHLLFGAIGVAIATAVFTTQASLTATGDEFAEGMNAVFVFATIVAVIGLVNSYFIRTKDVRRAEARG